MLSQNARWEIAPVISPEADRALSGFPPILRQVLYNRGYQDVESANRYLAALPLPNTDPFLLKGMKPAVDRISTAMANNENIVIYGDYDVDGVTATALLTQVLSESGANVSSYIPNRFDEGYGLNIEAIDSIRKEGANLVITVDCGIRSVEEVKFANEVGVDIIITDHHHPGVELPQALAIINPKQDGDIYIDKDLAGVGIAYKLAEALLSQQSEPQPHGNILDLVALGTVADLAPLRGENRRLVRAGLSEIRQPHRQGIMALIGVSGLKAQSVNAVDIGFRLGPRLNAAGRLESALDALKLLTTQDIFEAGHLAQKLDIQNRERQEITQTIQEDAAILAFAREPDPLLLIAINPSYNAGVVGLAASRLVEQFYRPSIVAQQQEEFTRGSCRSIPEFHITRALDECADLLTHHGGHAAAAGFTILNTDLEEFIERMNAIAERELGALDLRPTLHADMTVQLSELKPDLLPILEMMEPTGYGNPQTVFVTRDLRIRNSRQVGRENTHLKLSVTDGVITYDAIAFRMGHLWETLPDSIDLMYTFEINEFNGRQFLQLNVKDIKYN